MYRLDQTNPFAFGYSDTVCFSVSYVYALLRYLVCSLAILSDSLSLPNQFT